MAQSPGSEAAPRRGDPGDAGHRPWPSSGPLPSLSRRRPPAPPHARPTSAPTGHDSARASRPRRPGCAPARAHPGSRTRRHGHPAWTHHGSRSSAPRHCALKPTDPVRARTAPHRSPRTSHAVPSRWASAANDAATRVAAAARRRCDGLPSAAAAPARPGRHARWLAPPSAFSTSTSTCAPARRTLHTECPVRKLAGSSRWWSAAISAPVPPCQRINAGALGYPCTRKGA